MREKKLYQAIDKRIPRSIHRQSMTGASRTMTGTPDRYYDGPARDLWVEYKQLDRAPRDGMVHVAPIDGVPKQPKGRLSDRQKEWLERRFANGRNAIVVVGLPNRRAVLMHTPAMWANGCAVSNAVSVDEVAAWIYAFCGG